MGASGFSCPGRLLLNRDIGEWFHAAGLLILEGYGLTESTAGACINRPDHYKLGSVGLPFEGTSVRISDDGEIQIRGGCVMDGYHNLPDESAKAFTNDGWLRTGDVGAFDADGFLTVTGRIKEIFKTSNGKYIAPPAIEAKFMAICPYASQFMVFGEAHSYCVALIALDADLISMWARENGLDGLAYGEFLGRRARAARTDRRLHRHTERRTEPMGNRQEVGATGPRPVHRAWRAEHRSLKVKRSAVAEQNKQLLDALYG